MESRLADIEVKLSYNEESLEELSRTIYRQQQEIDQLRKDLRALGEQVRISLSRAAPNPGERPPHY
jgi:SlyX protein